MGYIVPLPPTRRASKPPRLIEPPPIIWLVWALAGIVGIALHGCLHR